MLWLCVYLSFIKKTLPYLFSYLSLVFKLLVCGFIYLEDIWFRVLFRKKVKIVLNKLSTRNINWVLILSLHIYFIYFLHLTSHILYFPVLAGIYVIDKMCWLHIYAHIHKTQQLLFLLFTETRDVDWLFQRWATLIHCGLHKVHISLFLDPFHWLCTSGNK